MERWRLLDTGRSAGPYNMAVDEGLTQSVVEKDGRPILRLFGWNPPTVSFGYGQDPAREVDLEKCRRAGVELVRRPTGGRAVLHWEELTYSLICRQDHPRLGGGIEETYRVIGECLVESLRRFGAPVVLEPASQRPTRPRGAGATAPCFSSISRWEVKCRGRKLIGSAQRRVDGAILQHGSLMLGEAHCRILDLLPSMPDRLRSAWQRQLEEHSICLGECVEREIEVAELVSCLADGFSRCLGVGMCSDVLTPREELRARELVAKKYGDPFRRTPDDTGNGVIGAVPETDLLCVEP